MTIYGLKIQAVKSKSILQFGKLTFLTKIIKWPFHDRIGQKWFHMTFFFLYFDIMTEKLKNLTLLFFLGDLTWNRPLLEV